MKKNDIDELAEAKINEAYVQAIEKATGIKPLSEIKDKREPAVKRSRTKKKAQK